MEREIVRSVTGQSPVANAQPWQVAARARTENFPVASLLFPRALRPHLRAVYGFARLVDILGDEAEGDRLALLEELERQVAARHESKPMPGPRRLGFPRR